MKTRFLKPLLAAPLLALALTLSPGLYAQIDISVSVGLPPPALPEYDQPAIPADGYMWTPGYWAWNPNQNDYYWVPGTWVNAPYVGALWTPGYWEMSDNQYRWNRGYWGDHIGYYGGINYGFGYAGVGYQGGYWNRGAFSYNRSVNNVSNVHVTNVYNTRITNVQNSRVSFNGGRAGVQMTPTKSEQIINSMPHNRGAEHITEKQTQHETMAGAQPEQHYANNHGVPKVAATPEAGSYDTNRNAAAREASRPAPKSEQRHAERPVTVAPTRNEPVRAEQHQSGNSEPRHEQKAAPQAANRGEPVRTEQRPPSSPESRSEPKGGQRNAEPAERQAGHGGPEHEQQK